MIWFPYRYYSLLDLKVPSVELNLHINDDIYLII
jgi:hypothetical protein